MFKFCWKLPDLCTLVLLVCPTVAQTFFLNTYNESCDPFLDLCTLSHKLICSKEGRRCICYSGFTYVNEVRSCLPIPQSSNDVCRYDAQCHAGKWGEYSKCSDETQTCQCFDSKSNGKLLETVLVDGTCYLQLYVGDLCQTDEECDKSIKGDAYCKIRDHIGPLIQYWKYLGEKRENLIGSCLCKNTHFWHYPSKECFKRSTKLNDSCLHTSQCQEGTLGRYSICNNETERCECYDGPHDSKGTIYDRELKKCFPKRAYKDPCVDDDECKVSLGPEAICERLDGHLNGTCYIQLYVGDSCQTDEECDKSIKGDTFCKVSNHTTEKLKVLTGTCQCKNTHFWYEPWGECIKRSTKLNDSCTITSQCQVGALGQYSICNNKTARCECYGGPHDSKGVIYNEELKKCFPRRAYKDPCEDDDVCKASLGPNSKCGTVDGHPHRMVCYNDSNRRSSTALIAVVAICILLVLGAILVGFFFLRRRHIRRRAKSRKVKRKLSTVGGESLLPTQSCWTAYSNLSIRIYPAEEVTLLTEIGQGYFAIVYKGKLNDGIIAVKKVRDEHSTAVIREIETMASFSHPNILPLLGVAKVSDSAPPWLLFEFMEHGDLATVLRNEKLQPNSSTLTRDLVVMNKEEYQLPRFRLTDDKLLNIAMQIAEGMKYLAFHRFVHRDLAARNCLVGATGIIKISDFGLSRDVYSGDHYRARGNKYMPVRWMDPESIMYGRFTVESDVWAYGIVLWEIYSWGKQPYFGYSNDQVIKRITDGVLLAPPKDSPPFIQEMMTGCWQKQPSDRLNFQEICEKFSTLDNAPNEVITEYEIPRNANEPEPAYFQIEVE